MAKNVTTPGRLSVTMGAEMRPKINELQDALGKNSAAKALECLTEMYLDGQLVLRDGKNGEQFKMEGKREVLKPIADYLALIFTRAGLEVESGTVEAALGSVVGVTSATHEHFDLPLNLVMQIQALTESARREGVQDKQELFNQLTEMNKTLKAIAISTEITTMKMTPELYKSLSS